MKKFLLIISIIFLFSNIAIAAETNLLQLQIFQENKLFGLKDSQNNQITKPEFRKMIKIGEEVWLVQKNTRYGLINSHGKYIVYPRYRHAERILGQYAKLGNSSDFGLYDGKGNMIIPPIYSSIELLYSKMFLTCKNYKYGVVDFNGKTILKNEFDDIYMPDRDTMMVLYEGEWFKFTKVDTNSNIANTHQIKINDKDITFTKIVSNTGVGSGYVAVSITDYLLKILSTLSPAYEETVDDLLLSHGAETIEIVKSPLWIIQFPYFYFQKYGKGYIAPNNGPLSPIKQSLRRKLK